MTPYTLCRLGGVRIGIERFDLRIEFVSRC
jgi:hypothetical protein